jgi:hypothetical protein
MSKPQNSSDVRKGFEVRSPLGPVWFVSYDKVEEDYAIFLEDADELSKEQALAKARACSQEDICSWFYEQFSWHEVERHGQLLTPAKRTLIPRALRARMRRISPQHDVVEAGLAS